MQKLGISGVDNQVLRATTEPQEPGMFPLTTWFASCYPHAVVIISITQDFH